MNEALVLQCRVVRQDRLILDEHTGGVTLTTCIDGEAQDFCIRAEDIPAIIEFLETSNANPCNRP